MLHYYIRLIDQSGSCEAKWRHKTLKYLEKLQMFLNMTFIILFLMEYIAVECQEIENATSSVNVIVGVINRDINESIVSSNFKAVSLLQCSYICHRQPSESLYYLEDENKCLCNNQTDSKGNVTGSSNMNVYYGEYTRKTEVFDEQDCYSLYQSGFVTDGVYQIKLNGSLLVDTWCDMKNGGWTVIQNRYDGSVSFDRTISDYKSGFGDVFGEYWLGLEHMHHLTTTSSEMYLDMTAPTNATPQNAYIRYFNATVGDETTQYTLNFSSYETNCELFSFYNPDENRSPFLAPSGGSDPYYFCPETVKGGWWYGSCGPLYPNGVYGTAIVYIPCWGNEFSLEKTIMKVRRISNVS